MSTKFSEACTLIYKMSSTNQIRRIPTVTVTLYLVRLPLAYSHTAQYIYITTFESIFIKLSVGGFFQRGLLFAPVTALSVLNTRPRSKLFCGRYIYIHKYICICICIIRKSKDYVYGIRVYKALGIWKGYYRVKKITGFIHDTVNRGKK